jgi:hypothetical protein
MTKQGTAISEQPLAPRAIGSLPSKGTSNMSNADRSAHRGTFGDHSIRQFVAPAPARSIRSIPDPRFRNCALDPQELRALSRAYDLACQTLQNIGQLEVDREIIAREILRAAEGGERDASTLCERAILGLTAHDYRQHRT